jgi:hypothetical protein
MPIILESDSETAASACVDFYLTGIRPHWLWNPSDTCIWPCSTFPTTRRCCDLPNKNTTPMPRVISPGETFSKETCHKNSGRRRYLQIDFATVTLFAVLFLLATKCTDRRDLRRRIAGHGGVKPLSIVYGASVVATAAANIFKANGIPDVEMLAQLTFRFLTGRRPLHVCPSSLGGCDCDVDHRKPKPRLETLPEGGRGCHKV